MTSMRPERLVASTMLAFLGASARPAHAEGPTLLECLSANESSIHLRGDHKLRQARDQALVCASSACPEEVRDVCQRRITALSTAIPTVVFLAKDAAGHDLTAVRVSMDGEPLADRLDGTGVPIDPGLHAFTFEVAGQPAAAQSFVIGEGERNRHETILVGAAAAPIPSALPSPTSPVPSGLSPVTRSTPGREPRIAGFVVGAVGVVGLGIGAVFGGLAASDWSSAKTYCQGKTAACTKSGPGFQDERSAQSMATISTLGFIAGGALAAAGVVFFVTAPRRSPSEAAGSARRVELVPTAGPGEAGLLIRGWL
jgi:hypothetical protein